MTCHREYLDEFDGLDGVGDHYEVVSKLLHELGTLHALTKLRLHTESTVSSLVLTTKNLDAAFRELTIKTCEAHAVLETKHEIEKRMRRMRRKMTSSPADSVMKETHWIAV